MPGALVARPESSKHLRIEVAVAVHRLLEDLDRARQRTDLVGAVGMRHLDAFGALGDALDGMRMTESGRAIERAMIRTPITTATSAAPPRPVRTKAIVWLASVCCASFLLRSA